jgi:hypothetical protein
MPIARLLDREQYFPENESQLGAAKRESTRKRVARERANWADALAGHPFLKVRDTRRAAIHAGQGGPQSQKTPSNRLIQPGRSNICHPNSLAQNVESAQPLRVIRTTFAH